MSRASSELLQNTKNMSNNNQQSTVLNKSKLDNLANEIWKSAERLRGKFKAYEYQSVVLPIIVIRRLECVLIEWRKTKAEEIRSSVPNAASTIWKNWLRKWN